MRKFIIAKDEVFFQFVDATGTLTYTDDIYTAVQYDDEASCLCRAFNLGEGHNVVCVTIEAVYTLRPRLVADKV